MKTALRSAGLAFSLVVSLAANTQLLAATTLSPTSLRCEYVTAPLGVDVASPRLFWKLEGPQRGQRQTAYQILVATAAESLAKDQGDLWDSGKVASDATIHVPYAGPALKSSQRVFWKVRVWDQDDRVSGWSQPASWTMGLLAKNDWQASWISAKDAATAQRKSIGYHAGETKQQDEVKWVQVDLGQSLPLTTIRLHAMRHAGHDGFGFPIRFKVDVSEEAAFKESKTIADHSQTDFPNPGYAAVPFDAQGAKGRFVRVTVSKMWKINTAARFALSQLEVISNGRNVAEGATVSAKDSVENYGWGKAGLTDGGGYVGAKVSPYETMLLRREFTVKPGLRRAVAHICGLGQYEMSINGQAVSEDLLTPGWTKYDKTCLYDTRDLTPLLREGRNAAGLLLGNGMYNVKAGRYTKFKGTFGPLKAIAHLRLEYADGTTEIIGTDEHWRVTPGPITFSCIYGGEDYDARLEPRGWNLAGYDDSKWETALSVKGPGGQLRGLSSAAPPLRAFDVLKPARVTPLKPGVAVYDLGQNAPLMPRLKVKGQRGDTVRITPAELLRADGSVDRGSSGGGAAYWQYTLAGLESETWFPKFWYHGSRYFQVELQPASPGGALPVVESLEGVVVHTASEPIGEFSCSNELFNRIHTLIRWAQRANLVSVITDCPHRERLGWLEQYHLNGPALRYEFDLAQLFTKGMIDMADSQLADGLVPDIAPEYTVFNGGFRDSPEWGSAYVIVPWQQYEWTGDVELLRRHFDGMKRYVAYLGSKAKDHIVSHGLGDWYDIGPRGPGPAQLTPTALTATAFYYQDAWILAKAAALLGHPDDAKKYEELAAQIRAAFNRKFFNPKTRQYSTGSQCANSIPLVMNLTEPAQRAAVVENVVQDVRRRGNALTAGDVGYRYLLRALADGGRSDVIFDMNNQSEKPGYGYQLKRGATSLTEAWDAGRGSSQNHFMLGHIIEWFYHDLVGIGVDPAGPGFKKIVIQPQPVGGITWAQASYDSVRGKIVSDWKKAEGSFTLAVSIPANTTATVVVPAGSADQITESGQIAERSPGVRLVRRNAATAIYEIGSGQYDFHVGR